MVIGFGKPKVLRFDKPFLAGWSVLELSKCFMYSCWYREIKQRTPSAELLMSDTDSFLLKVRNLVS